VLAEIVRLDRTHPQRLTPNSELAEAIKVLARVHQSLIWMRQRQANQLRSMLREFYPAALRAFDDLAGRDALAVLAAAPTPAAGHALTVETIIDLLRQAGRRRYLNTTAEKIYRILQAEHLQARPHIAEAYGASTHALVLRPPGQKARPFQSKRRTDSGGKGAAVPEVKAHPSGGCGVAGPAGVVSDSLART
jgi:hypothetical protein